MSLAPKTPYFSPAYKLLLGILRPLEAVVPGLKVRTAIPDETDFSPPFLMCRPGVDFYTTDSYGDSDNRFDRRFVADIQTWCREAKEEGEASAEDRNFALQELAYQALQTAWLEQTVVPGVGSINKMRITSPAHRVADWATATGVNQYANLARGMTRYQAEYAVIVRPDFDNLPTTDDLIATLGN